MDRPAPKPSATAPAGRNSSQGKARTQMRDQNRERAIHDMLRNTSAQQVLSMFNLGEGVRGGPSWVKFEVGNGMHMNVRMDTCGFKVLERTPIPPLTGRDGVPKDGGKGAIDLTIALMFFEGGCPSNPVEARRMAMQKLQETFHPNTLSADYKPGPGWKPTPKAPPKPPEKPKPCDLPPYDERNRSLMVRYLTETRGLPARLVKHLIDHRLAYPSVRWFEYEDRNTKAKKFGTSPVMVFPYFHVTEGFATGFEHKDIPRDLVSKTKGISSGPKPDSVVLMNQIRPGTKKISLTEAPIDAFSKWVLDAPPRDTVIVATVGVRLVPALLAKAKEVGAEVESAFDCDEAGTRVARQVDKECKKLGIPHSYAQPKESEAVIEIPDDSFGKKRLDDLMAHCDKLGLPYKLDPKETKGLHRICVGNTIDMWDLLHRWKDEDNLRLADPRNSAEDRARIKAEPKFDVEIRRNKDWNDVLKSQQQPVPPVLKWGQATPKPTPSPIAAAVSPVTTAASPNPPVHAKQPTPDHEV